MCPYRNSTYFRSCGDLWHIPRPSTGTIKWFRLLDRNLHASDEPVFFSNKSDTHIQKKMLARACVCVCELLCFVDAQFHLISSISSNVFRRQIEVRV